MKSKKLVVGLLSLAMLGSVTAVGCNNGGSSDVEATTIVIYAGGSSEFSWAKGTEEQKVYDAVEQKYYEDTGIKLKFKFEYLGQNMKQKLQTSISGGEQVDIVISHTTTDGIDEYSIQKELFYDISSLLEDYGENIIKYTTGSSLNRMTLSDGKVIGIGSVIDPHKFGILVRKDIMEKAGYTDDAEKAKTEFKDGVNYKLVDSLEVFEEMCLAMKEVDDGISYPVTGAHWDIEKVLTLGPYCESGRYTYTARETADGDIEVIPGYLTPEYADVLETEYYWVRKGILSSEANSILIDEAETKFISGQSAVFVEDPTIQHLIQIARRTKVANPDAEFTVLGALPLTSGGETKGFMSNSEATHAAVIMKNSKNAKAIIKFMNWVYSDVDNYRLCYHGIEGEHWIDNGDGTYSYPEGKESYLTKRPYSGILALVENQNISNLTYAGYTEEEKSWINTAKTTTYIENELIDYNFNVSSELRLLHSNGETNMYSVLNNVFAGTKNPKENDKIGEAQQSYRTTAQKYIEAITVQYKFMKNSRG